MPLTDPRKISVPSEAPMITMPRRLPNINAPAPTTQPSGATAAIATSAGLISALAALTNPSRPSALSGIAAAAHDRGRWTRRQQDERGDGGCESQCAHGRGHGAASGVDVYVHQHYPLKRFWSPVRPPDADMTQIGSTRASACRRQQPSSSHGA